MADPLSIAAGVAGLITLAAQTAKLIATIADEVKGRKGELLSIGQEISTFHLILDDLKSQLSSQEDNAARNEGLDALLAGCNRTLQSIQDLLGQIRDGHAKGGFSKMQAQLMYSSKMKNLEGLRGLLDKYKATLSIALLVMRADTLSIPKVREDLRKVEEPVSSILQGTAAGPQESKEDRDVLRNYLYSSSKELVARVNQTESVASSTPTDGSDTLVPPTEEKDVVYSSFDKWLASFTPADTRETLKTPAQRLEYMRKTRQEMEEGLRKKGSTARYSEDIEVDPDAMTFELLRTLFKKGYHEICGFRSLDSQIHFGTITGVNAPYAISVTSGPSSFDPVSGYKINQDQRFIEYYNEYVSLKDQRYPIPEEFERREAARNIAKSPAFKVRRGIFEGDDALLLDDERNGEEIPFTHISFRRTLRLLENYGNENDGLPAQLSPFPLFSVSSHASNLSKEMVKMGGVFIPMFQREALSICFSGEGPTERERGEKPQKWVTDYDYSENYAVRIYAGAINVVSGQRGNSDERDVSSTQDFMVIPKQERLDGFCTGNGLIKQFVAMPMGKGYSVEHQLTRQESIGGIQLEIAPRYKTSVLFARAKQLEPHRVANEEALDSPFDLFLTPSEAQLSPGEFLFMQPLDRDWHQPTQQLKLNNPGQFPKKEFFGTAPRREWHDFSGARPTFLRELVAWMPRNASSEGHELEVVSPIPVPISWGTWDHQWRKKPGTATVRLSPFLDIREITMLREEAKRQHVSNFPENWDYARPAKRSTEPESFYMPLYSLAQEYIALVLEEALIGAAAPFRMSLGAGATRKQRIRESADKRMFAWEKALVINIHILNSVAFADVTGLTPPPCPISWKEYAASRLPFYKDPGKELETHDTLLSLTKSVQEMDLNAGIVWDVVLEVEEKALTGCAYCETNLADTFLRSCHHVFCSLCIKQWMIQNDTLTCPFCGAQMMEDERIVFSAPTAIVMKGELPAAVEYQYLLTQPADILDHLDSWGRSRFRTESVAKMLQKAIELADHSYPAHRQEQGTTYPFDFILANLLRLPTNLLRTEEHLPILADGLYAAAKGKTGYCLDRLLPLCPPARELDSLIPGRVGEILNESCSYQERQSLILLEWACKEGHNPDDWGMTIASASWRASPAVIKRMLELGADPDLTNDDPDDSYFGMGKGALHQLHDNALETLQILLEAGARIDLQDFNGRTPIHAAAAEAMTGTLGILLSKPGARRIVNLKDKRGDTAMGLLKKSRVQGARVAEVEALLLKAGADQLLEGRRQKRWP